MAGYSQPIMKPTARSLLHVMEPLAVAILALGILTVRGRRAGSKAGGRVLMNFPPKQIEVDPPISFRYLSLIE